MNTSLDLNRVIDNILDKLLYWFAMRDATPEQRAEILRARAEANQYGT